MSSEIESIMAINSFIEENEIAKDSHGNCKFQALVQFKSNRKAASKMTEVKFIRNGYQGGTIKIEELDDLNSQDFHLEFNPNYQNYHFNEVEKSLEITGTSDKMKGKYSVTISAIS